MSGANREGPGAVADAAVPRRGSPSYLLRTPSWVFAVLAILITASAYRAKLGLPLAALELHRIDEVLDVSLTALLRPRSDVYYRPLSPLIFQAVHAVAGLSAAAFHGLHLLFHLANVGLVFRLALLLACSPQAAALAAVLFGVFAVPWVAVTALWDITEPMALTFSLVALLGGLRFLRDGSRRLLAFTIVSFALAIAAKPTAYLVILWLAAHILLRRKEAFGRSALLLFSLSAIVLAHFLWLMPARGVFERWSPSVTLSSLGTFARGPLFGLLPASSESGLAALILLSAAGLVFGTRPTRWLIAAILVVPLLYPAPHFEPRYWYLPAAFAGILLATLCSACSRRSRLAILLWALLLCLVGVNIHCVQSRVEAYSTQGKAIEWFVEKGRQALADGTVDPSSAEPVTFWMPVAGLEGLGPFAALDRWIRRALPTEQSVTSAPLIVSPHGLVSLRCEEDIRLGPPLTNGYVLAPSKQRFLPIRELAASLARRPAPAVSFLPGPRPDTVRPSFEGDLGLRERARTLTPAHSPAELPARTPFPLESRARELCFRAEEPGWLVLPFSCERLRRFAFVLDGEDVSPQSLSRDLSALEVPRPGDHRLSMSYPVGWDSPSPPSESWASFLLILLASGIAGTSWAVAGDRRARAPGSRPISV